MTLSLRKWVTYRADELRRCKVDPGTRLRITGHKQPIAEPWIRTVGYWCRADNFFATPTERGILGEMEPATFAMYKRRWFLRTGKQFRAIEGYGDYRLAYACYTVYQSLGELGRGTVPMGERCIHVGKKIGVFPVEAVLWTQLFTEMLACNNCSVEHWESLTPEDQYETWSAGDGEGAWDVERLFKRPWII